MRRRWQWAGFLSWLFAVSLAGLCVRFAELGLWYRVGIGAVGVIYFAVKAAILDARDEGRT